MRGARPASVERSSSKRVSRDLVSVWAKRPNMTGALADCPPDRQAPRGVRGQGPLRVGAQRLAHAGELRCHEVLGHPALRRWAPHVEVFDVLAERIMSRLVDTGLLARQEHLDPLGL